MFERYNQAQTVQEAAADQHWLHVVSAMNHPSFVVKLLTKDRITETEAASRMHSKFQLLSAKVITEEEGKKYIGTLNQLTVNPDGSWIERCAP
jgi:hypothetical protein